VHHLGRVKMKKQAREGKKKKWVVREDELKAMVAELVAEHLREAQRDIPRREASDEDYGIEWCAC
jgi:hypothetical protein